jgi:hypothetical protein
MVGIQVSHFLHAQAQMKGHKLCMQDGKECCPDKTNQLIFCTKTRCEVLTSNITTCPEPEASAFDHHEGSLGVKVTKKLYIRSDPQGSPKMVNIDVTVNSLERIVLTTPFINIIHS